MTILKILQYPDLRLKRKAITLTHDEIKTHDVQKIIDDMFETMFADETIAALTSTQLNITADHVPSIIVINSIENVLPKPICLINLKITDRRGHEDDYEACMSVYGNNINAKVKRAKQITIQALDRNANEINLQVDGFLSRCLQHEEDHLHGILYIDYVSKLKLNLIKKKIDKLKNNDL